MIFFSLKPHILKKKKSASHLEQALRKDEYSVSRVLVESDNYKEGLQSLEKANLPKDVHYIVNLTGGTKIMSLMVYDFFREFNCTFYYIPIGKNIYCNIEDGQMESLRYRISLKEYFTLYGLLFECNNTLLKDKKQHFAFFEKQKKRNFFLSKEITCSKQATTKEDKDTTRAHGLKNTPT